MTLIDNITRCDIFKQYYLENSYLICYMTCDKLPSESFAPHVLLLNALIPRFPAIFATLPNNSLMVIMLPPRGKPSDTLIGPEWLHLNLNKISLFFRMNIVSHTPSYQFQVSQISEVILPKS